MAEEENEIFTIGSSSAYTVVEVHSLANVNSPGALLFDVTLTNPLGVTERHDHYLFRTSDPFGASPALWQWLIDNPEFPIAPYTPPTAEEARSMLAPVSRRQLRLALVRNSISIASVEAIIASMPDGQAKEEAQIEWSDATMFERTHPTLLAVGAALGLSDEAVDAMWAQALAI